jgi:hypothetical protein
LYGFEFVKDKCGAGADQRKSQEISVRADSTAQRVTSSDNRPNEQGEGNRNFNQLWY